MRLARMKPNTLSALNTLVSEAIDVVVHTDRTADGPQVMSILAVEDLVGGADAVQFTATEVFERGLDGKLAWTGQIPSRLAKAFERVGIDTAELLATSSSSVNRAD